MTAIISPPLIYCLTIRDIHGGRFGEPLLISNLRFKKCKPDTPTGCLTRFIHCIRPDPEIYNVSCQSLETQTPWNGTEFFVHVDDKTGTYTCKHQSKKVIYLFEVVTKKNKVEMISNLSTRNFYHIPGRADLPANENRRRFISGLLTNI